MNAPDRMDAFRVPDGVAPIQPTKDGKVANAFTYKFARQDHTLGNMLRMELLRDPKVKFVGYKHPHPLDNDILLRIQTQQGFTPKEALVHASQRLQSEFQILTNGFGEEVKRMQREKEQLHEGM